MCDTGAAWFCWHHAYTIPIVFDGAAIATAAHQLWENDTTGGVRHLHDVRSSAGQAPARDVTNGRGFERLVSRGPARVCWVQSLLGSCSEEPMNRTTLITFGLSIAACSSSTSQTPTTEEYDDTAQAIASSTASSGGNSIGGGDVMAFADAMSIARGKLPLGFVLGSDHHVHGNRMGLDNAFAVTCKDAAGTVLTTCDDTTDSATVELSWKGSLETSHLTATVDREGSWTVTGLQSATATISGDSSLSLDSTMTSIFHEGVTSTDTFDSTAAYDAIQVDTDTKHIASGTVSFEIKGHRTVTGTTGGTNDVDKSFDVHAVLTFNGDQTATLVLDGTQTFTIDLKKGGCKRGK